MNKQLLWQATKTYLKCVLLLSSIVVGVGGFIWLVSTYDALLLVLIAALVLFFGVYMPIYDNYQKLKERAHADSIEEYKNT